MSDTLNAPPPVDDKPPAPPVDGKPPAPPIDGKPPASPVDGKPPAPPVDGKPPAPGHNNPPPGDLPWHASIKDPKNKEYAARFTGADDIVETTLKLRDEVSKRVKPLDDTSTDEDKAKFRKAFGVPDKPEEYKIEPAEGIEFTELDKKVLNDLLPIAHEAGIPGPAMNKFVNKFMELQKTITAETMEKIHEFGRNSETELKREWGPEYQKNVHVANQVGSVLGGPAFKTFLNETPLATGGLLGDHPLMVRFLATIGRRSDEGELLLGSSPEQRQSVQSQIDELMRTVPPGSRQYTSKEHQTKLQELYGKLHGRDAIVGSQGRQL